MLHLLQKDVFGEHHYAKLVEALERLKLPYYEPPQRTHRSLADG